MMPSGSICYFVKGAFKNRINGLRCASNKGKIRLKRGLENLRNIWQLDKTIFLEEKEEANKQKMKTKLFLL